MCQFCFALLFALFRADLRLRFLFLHQLFISTISFPPVYRAFSCVYAHVPIDEGAGASSAFGRSGNICADTSFPVRYFISNYESYIDYCCFTDKAYEM